MGRHAAGAVLRPCCRPRTSSRSGLVKLAPSSCSLAATMSASSFQEGALAEKLSATAGAAPVVLAGAPCACMNGGDATPLQTTRTGAGAAWGCGSQLKPVALQCAVVGTHLALAEQCAEHILQPRSRGHDPSRGTGNWCQASVLRCPQRAAVAQGHGQVTGARARSDLSSGNERHDRLTLPVKRTAQRAAEAGAGTRSRGELARMRCVHRVVLPV